ncbi:MAG: hypothetical protein Q6M04_07140, partial [Thermostichus sp. BF3_bins_97]
MLVEPLTSLAAMQTILYRSETLAERRRRVENPLQERTGIPGEPNLARPLASTADLSQIPFEDAVAEARFQAWQQAAAKGDPDKFLRRLTWDGITAEQLRWWLRDPEPWELPPAQWPEWATLLQAVLQAASSLDPQAYGYLDPEQPLPFEPFFQPFLSVARQALAQRVANPPLSETARLTLEWSLIEQLSELATPTLLGAFQAFRSSGDPMRAFLRQYLKTPSPSQTQYWAFLRAWCGDNLATQLQEYSVLGRVLATATLHWVEATAE